MRRLETLVQGNYSREELRFKSSTDGNSEGNSLTGNKVKEAMLISRQHDTYPAVTRTQSVPTRDLSSQQEERMKQGIQQKQEAVQPRLFVCSSSLEQGSTVIMKSFPVLSSFMPLISGSQYQ